MKKIFIAIVALAAATACSNSEIVSLNQEAIAFDNAFVNNSVRSVNDPSYSNTNMFADFQVYGYVENAPLFNADNTGVTVSKNITNDELNSDWKYEGTQYWIAGAKYNFAAVAPMTNGGWEKTAADATSTTLSFTNNGETDLLYAYAAQEGKVSGNETVAFTFRHVLSKVKFSFENGYNATNATIRVKNIQITDAYASGEVVLAANTTWTNQDGTLVLNFGNAALTEADNAALTTENDKGLVLKLNDTVESYNELFLIPSASRDYTVTFTVELLVSGQEVAQYTHTATATFAPQPGNAYDIKTVITATNIDPEHKQEPIEFTVNTLPDWGTTTDVNVPQN